MLERTIGALVRIIYVGVIGSLLRITCVFQGLYGMVGNKPGYELNSFIFFVCDCGWDRQQPSFTVP